MRDPNRIDKYCDLLREIWHRYPDLRFSQLIMNVLVSPGDYYKEDEDFFTFLNEFYF